jgi:hypothetical protein
LTPRARIPLPAAQIHAMPVEETDLGLAAQGYGRLLVSLAGGRARRRRRLVVWWLVVWWIGIRAAPCAVPE